jgi:hypothetical protein
LWGLTPRSSVSGRPWPAMFRLHFGSPVFQDSPGGLTRFASVMVYRWPGSPQVSQT